MGDDLSADLGTITGFFAIPYTDEQVITPMEFMQEVGLKAPAASSVNIESDLFVSDNDPYGVKTYPFNSIAELNNCEFKVYTGRIGYIRAWYTGGGDILTLSFNKQPLKYYKKNAFVLMIKPNGTVHQVEDGNDAVQTVSFKMLTNLPSSENVWIWSEALGGAAVQMSRTASQTWAIDTCYYNDMPFEFTVWSDNYNILTDGVSVNGTIANYVVEKDPGTKKTWPKHHFKGYVKSGTYYNGGAANIKIAVHN